MADIAGIRSQTAPEIISSRADSSKPYMGLISWRGVKPRKEDVTIAKNYLTEDELLALNNLVEQYLVFAEGQAMRRIPMYMGDWIEKLHGFLKLNDRDILTDAGKVSHELAVEIAEKHYGEYKKNEAKQLDDDFDKIALEAAKIDKRKETKKK